MKKTEYEVIRPMTLIGDFSYINFCLKGYTAYCRAHMSYYKCKIGMLSFEDWKLIVDKK